MSAVYGYNFTLQEHLDFYNFTEQFLSNGGNQITNLDKQVQYYLSGNSEKLSNLYLSFLSENTPKIVYNYFHDFLHNRDLKMGERMKPFLNQGNSFTAVGASHLSGIINYLRASRYQVTSISISPRGSDALRATEDPAKLLETIEKGRLAAKKLFGNKFRPRFYHPDSEGNSTKELKAAVSEINDGNTFEPTIEL